MDIRPLLAADAAARSGVILGRRRGVAVDGANRHRGTRAAQARPGSPARRGRGSRRGRRGDPGHRRDCGARDHGRRHRCPAGHRAADPWRRSLAATTGSWCAWRRTFSAISPRHRTWPRRYSWPPTGAFPSDGDHEQAAGWVRAAAVHTALNVLRGERRREQRQVLMHAATHLPGPEETVIGRETQAELRRVLRRLPRRSAALLGGDIVSARPAVRGDHGRPGGDPAACGGETAAWVTAGPRSAATPPPARLTVAQRRPDHQRLAARRTHQPEQELAQRFRAAHDRADRKVRASDRRPVACRDLPPRIARIARRAPGRGPAGESVPHAGRAVLAIPGLGGVLVPDRHGCRGGQPRAARAWRPTAASTSTCAVSTVCCASDGLARRRSWRPSNTKWRHAAWASP
jgi:hypothetical protein